MTSQKQIRDLKTIRATTQQAIKTYEEFFYPQIDGIYKTVKEEAEKQHLTANSAMVPSTFQTIVTGFLPEVQAIINARQGEKAQTAPTSFLGKWQARKKSIHAAKQMEEDSREVTKKIQEKFGTNNKITNFDVLKSPLLTLGEKLFLIEICAVYSTDESIAKRDKRRQLPDLNNKIQPIYNALKEKYSDLNPEIPNKFSKFLISEYKRIKLPSKKEIKPIMKEKNYALEEEQKKAKKIIKEHTEEIVAQFYSELEERLLSELDGAAKKILRNPQLQSELFMQYKAAKEIFDKNTEIVQGNPGNHQLQFMLAQDRLKLETAWDAFAKQSPLCSQQYLFAEKWRQEKPRLMTERVLESKLSQLITLWTESPASNVKPLASKEIDLSTLLKPIAARVLPSLESALYQHCRNLRGKFSVTAPIEQLTAAIAIPERKERERPATPPLPRSNFFSLLNSPAPASVAASSSLGSSSNSISSSSSLPSSPTPSMSSQDR